jgi:hypothetical protein
MNKKQVLDFLKANKKKILAGYIGWSFIHLVFFLIGLTGGGDDYRFWPAEMDYSSIYKSIFYTYDFSELMVYVGTPAVVYVIYKLLSK